MSLPPFHPQLTDPVVPFHLYDAFISLAKTLHADPGHDPGTNERGFLNGHGVSSKCFAELRAQGDWLLSSTVSRARVNGPRWY